ncbi:alpha/beta-hydrolase [Cryphonectria parasitica EP155]|uniref:Alpha/beta-hydrolase n=1 Tax=Cryphonectria parasitica (strain ATCC 38755 / EP155) TaxID=660469 RepID=A0A9P4YA03_CRYP1|nr:alpha/beta-hydrolase [Cryphonectria parasitica EP155]KAF3769062.1 alpha/beta-hydrolase [Cryphonectria parasitica EP155]
MRLLSNLLITCILGLTSTALVVASSAAANPLAAQRPISHPDTDSDGSSTASISPSLFTSLERFARLVDIAYCVGTSGIYQPFTCASRCKDFPNLHLASTWNTGVLMSDSCGYVAVDHGSEDGREQPAIIVAFRGTYSLTNTVIDLSTVPQEYVPYPDPDEGDDDGGDNGGTSEQRCTNCTVHMGFLESWRQARRLVLPTVKSARAKHPGYPVRLVGHSLGGAVACLAALEMKVALGWDDLVVTTFGEPQVGNAGFVAFVDRVFSLNGSPPQDDEDEKGWAYRRVTHVKDPVPLLPLSEWGYRPHAGEVFITKKELSPSVEDLRLCRGDEDQGCIAEGSESSRLQLWQLLFAHRDYFWRLGLCVPGGDPSDWGRPPYDVNQPDEL